MPDPVMLESLKQIANGIAVHFGSSCEVAIHDLAAESPENTIVFIKNGHISHRKIGDGPSPVVLEALKHHPDKLEDRLAYLTRTHDGKILKSSTMYIRNEKGEVAAILAVNYDISSLLAAESALGSITSTSDREGSAAGAEPLSIPLNVNELLDELIAQSIRLVGKPVEMMTKDDKVRAIQFLNDSGAFLITRSGDKVSSTFRISKFTLYSYMDAGK